MFEYQVIPNLLTLDPKTDPITDPLIKTKTMTRNIESGLASFAGIGQRAHRGILQGSGDRWKNVFS